jgi:excisionase family DNA binding protein
MKRESPYLTTHEAAALLQVDRIRIYRLVAAERLRPLKIGRLLRFERTEVEAVNRVESLLVRPAT